MTDSILSSTGCEHIYYNKRQPSSVNIRTSVTSSGAETLVVLPCSSEEYGWILIQQRVDASVSFEKKYNQFMKPFGTPDGNYWAGLSNINHLSGTGVRLQIYLESFDTSDNVAVVYLDRFNLTNTDSRFRLILGSSSSPTSLGECLMTHQNNMFRTLNVVANQKGWWNSALDSDVPCCNLNGIYRENGVVPTGENHTNTIYWNSFRKNFEPLKKVKMSILPLN